MPKATAANTTTPPPIISGQAAISIADTIARMKQMAVVAQDHLYLSDGPANPDYELLEACAEGLHYGREARRIDDLRSKEFAKARLEREHDTDELFKLWQAAEGKMRVSCHKARNLPAKTPAGLFAKATLCRAHKTSAGVLAMSMADDFLACDEIRLAIWKPEAVA